MGELKILWNQDKLKGSYSEKKVIRSRREKNEAVYYINIKLGENNMYSLMFQNSLSKNPLSSIVAVV